MPRCAWEVFSDTTTEHTNEISAHFMCVAVIDYLMDMTTLTTFKRFENTMLGLKGKWGRNYMGWSEGFPLFVCFDHKNIERAESVMKHRRAAKKLVHWVADCQPMLHRVVRLWIDGKTNVITDCGSRAGWVNAVAKHIPLPIQPILDTIRDMFTAHESLEKKCTCLVYTSRRLPD